jgi:hypothetical protein
VEAERDYEMRLVAIDRIRELSQRYDDIVPLDVLRKGFVYAGESVSFGSFFSGIFRPRQMRGPAALTLITAPPKGTREAPYDDGLDETTNSFVYHYRTPQGPTARASAAAEADNEALKAAARLAVPLIYSTALRQANTRRSRQYLSHAMTHHAASLSSRRPCSSAMPATWASKRTRSPPATTWT